MPHLTSRAAVGQDAVGAHVLAAAEDFDTLLLVGQVLDAGALGEEAAVEHEKQVDGRRGCYINAPILLKSVRGGALFIAW